MAHKGIFINKNLVKSFRKDNNIAHFSQTIISIKSGASLIGSFHRNRGNSVTPNPMENNVFHAFHDLYSV